jgi:hypothetical protein
MIQKLKRFFIKNKYPPVLFSYPCVDPNTPFFEGKHVVVPGHTANTLGAEIIKKCSAKGAAINETIDADIDILIINTPIVTYDTIIQTEETYFDILFHYIKPAQKAVVSMLDRNKGQIVFVLPPYANRPSVEYAQMAAFAVVGMIKGLAKQYAPKGIVVNGIILGEKYDDAAIAEWAVFLASGNARNIIGECIVLD